MSLYDLVNGYLLKPLMSPKPEGLNDRIKRVVATNSTIVQKQVQLATDNHQSTNDLIRLIGGDAVDKMNEG